MDKHTSIESDPQRAIDTMIMVHIEYATVASINESGAWCARIYDHGTMTDVKDTLWGGTSVTLFLHAMTRILNELDTPGPVTFVISNPEVVNTIERSRKWQYADAKENMRPANEVNFWLKFWAARKGRRIHAQLMTPVVDPDLYLVAFEYAMECAIN